MGQYFDNENLKSNITKYKTSFLDKEFYFNTDNGVFSKERLDFGTRSLLESLPIQEMHGDILEVGCGYGVIPIILSKFVDAKFDGIDVNKRALHLANMNMKENKCNNITFFESNCYENVNKKYDFIITNPPIRAGKEIVYKILFEAKDYLKVNGKLYLVINKDQGAKSVLRDLNSVYNAELINKNKGFWIIKCNLR